ncbi:MAG: NYN domain-containing protein [Myxococcota bacterium]
MASDDTLNMAVFCDFENVAIGVRDARYEAFDIGLVLERILDKGKVVLKKAYADWDRYKSAKKPLHEASFELIEIPHVRISGKNSADIRLVVDALDLCYTKQHVDAFVIVSGDSDFSPLVSKLRENDKTVIGLGVKNSSSDLLIENCDEFIFYDDLVRKKRAAKKKKKPRPAPRPKPSASAPETPSAQETPSAADTSGDKEEAFELVLAVVESLFKDRDGALWGSMVKQTLKRRRPQFDESYYGYRSFNQLLDDMRKGRLLETAMDEKSGNFIIHGFGSDA